MPVQPTSPEAISKHALSLAWAGSAIGDFGPFLAFSERALEHIPNLGIKERGPLGGKCVNQSVLEDCCLSAVANANDPVARRALVNTIAAIDATWPQLDWQRGIHKSSFGQQIIEPIFAAMFYEQGALHPDLAIDTLRAVPSLIFTKVRERGSSEKPLLQAAIEQNLPDIIDALLRHFPHEALTTVASQMRYVHGAARERHDALDDLMTTAAQGKHVAPLEVLIQFSGTPEAAELGVKPVDGDRRCGLANLAGNEDVRLHLITPLLADESAASGLEPRLRHVYGLAVGSGHLAAAASLREHGFSKNAVMDAVYSEDAKLAWLEEALLAPEADVNERYEDVNGSAPLHMAVMRGNLELAGRLLVEGADPSLLNADGQTPYKVADKSIKAHFKTMLAARAAQGKVSDVLAQVRRKAVATTV